MTHELKTWLEVFQEVWDKNKTFEYRFNDREYKKGDELILKEYNQYTDQFTGRYVKALVTYILDGNTSFGVPEDYCIMSIHILEQDSY